MTEWRRGMLRVHGVDADAWARRHGVESWDGECSECGAHARVDVPFAWGTWRGLTALPCACGNTDVPFTVGWDSMIAASGGES